MKQLVIHTKEVASILGKSDDTARKVLQRIKDAYGKTKEQYVTIREFCEQEGFVYEDVFNMINGVPNKEK